MFMLPPGETSTMFSREKMHRRSGMPISGREPAMSLLTEKMRLLKKRIQSGEMAMELLLLI
jgi:hypothetical protein